jgi:hypothetical protein
MGAPLQSQQSGFSSWLFFFLFTMSLVALGAVRNSVDIRPICPSELFQLKRKSLLISVVTVLSQQATIYLMFLTSKVFVFLLHL